MEAAGDLIASAAELTAGVEDGVNHLQGGLAGLGLDVYGDAPAVVHHGNGVPLVDLHQYLRAEARQGLVNGVIHNLIDQVVEAGGGRGADIHAGPFPDGLQSLQDLDFRGVVLVARVYGGGIQNLVVCHILLLYCSFSYKKKNQKEFYLALRCGF